MGKRINTLNTASSPANDDYLPIDGATNGTRKISADFVNNLITDVEVDGTSVVTSGVAEINLSGKQDTLTAGSNIQIAQDGTISATDTTYTAGTNVQIDNGVISATDTTYTAGTGIDITNGVISSNVTPGSTVSVTQKTSTGTNIADITVDGVTTQLYAPNGGGGGSTVIPNPTGTPTDTLDTVSIDGTIYEIQGGGGSGTYISTLLNDGTAVQDVLTLSSDYTNFDELLITWMFNNNLYITTLKLNTSNISINDTITLNDYSSRDMVLTVTSTTTFTITSQTSGMGILSIRGLTYSKIAKEKSRDVLWTTGSWTMAHPITDYDEIIFKWGSTHSTCFIPSDIMTYESFIVINPDNDNFMWFDVTDASSFTVHQDNALTITSIEGVIYTKSEPTVFAEEMTQSEYDALPDEEKNNGCIYMVSSQASTLEELTEAQTNTSTAVTASSYNYDTHFNQYHYPWCAFNRVSPNPNEMAYPTPGVTTQTCWTPNVSQDGSNSWICYHFDRAYKMTSMTINSFTDYSSSATKSMVIEGSNDGTTWTNILLTGNSFSLDSYLHTLTTNNVNLNSDTAYEYVRLRSLEPMGESYQPSVFIDEIFVYGYKSEKALKKIYYMGTEYGNTGGGVVMTGATSSVNGTQGEAPQPLAGDQEKVLTGAGTWTSLDNIGTSQIYLGDLIPRVTSSDNHITASSEGIYGSTIWSAWGALTTDISIQNVPESNSAWVNANGDSAPWIMYYFDESRYFTEVEIKAFSNYGSDFSGTIYIEASNDASAWTDIGGGAKTINAALSTLTTNTYSISNNNSWRYIRIRGTQSFFELSNPACFFQSLQVKGGKAGGGIVQYIDFSSLSSQQVEDLQNKISGSSRTYLGQLIPRVSAADSKITASTSASGYPAWGAFNGTSPSSLSSPDANSCWLPTVNLTNQYIQYHFDAPRYFTKINIYCFSNYSTNWVGDIKIEGSSDGSTWENILASGDSTYELTAGYQSITNVEINLNDTDLWEYIRVTFVDEMSIAYQPSCFIDEIYVYGGSSGGENTRFESTELLSSAISTGGTYTLEDALENYDFVTIVSGASHESDIRTVAVEDILNTLSDGITVNLIGAADRWVNITACSGTSITIDMNAPYIHSIKGYKLVGGGGSSSHTYSTTEQKVGTWIDGSDVWEKTINIEESTIHSDTPFTIDIETNIGVLIEHSLMYRDSSFMNGRWNPLDGYTQQINDDMYYNRLYLESNGTLKSYFAGSLGAVTICGVIRYTKVSAS